MSGTTECIATIIESQADESGRELQIEMNGQRYDTISALTPIRSIERKALFVAQLKFGANNGENKN